MSAADFPVGSCLELNPGDAIEATYKGTLVHRGRVTDLAPDHNLFWIMDELRGGRRLLDLAELKVLRLPAPPPMQPHNATVAAASQGVQNEPPTH